MAHFINQVDLNLTRMIDPTPYVPEQLAGYVCNHVGSTPTIEDPTGLFPNQIEINNLIKDIRRKHPRDLLACVAMEFSAELKYTGAPQNGVPFTKFWIFAPDGKLLSSVDLDGRGARQYLTCARPVMVEVFRPMS